MGRRSQVKKKQKRKFQKHKKRLQKKLQTTPKVITSDSRTNLSLSPIPSVNNQSISSFGSPGSPLPTPDSVLTLPSTNELDETLGINFDALTAELNLRYNFEKPEFGENLEGQELVSHLKESNIISTGVLIGGLSQKMQKQGVRISPPDQDSQELGLYVFI